MEPEDLEEVPLTEEEKNYLVDGWLSYLHGLPADSDPNLAGLLHAPMFQATINAILVAHDFEPFTAAFRMGPDNELVLIARRLPTTRAIDG